MKRLNSIFQKVMVCMFMTIVVNTPLFAQDLEEEEPIKDPRSEQTFRLIYIAQGNEEEMRTDDLAKNLETTYGSGVSKGPMIFYLAGGQEDGPIIVTFGCGKDLDYDKEGNMFEKNVLENIRNPKRFDTNQDDKKRLLQLLYNTDEKEDGVSIFDDARQPLYKETIFEFHVGQNFWDTGKNETIIASLYFELNMKQYIDARKFLVNVYCPRKMNYDQEKPYGLLNIDDCNKNLKPIGEY